MIALAALIIAFFALDLHHYFTLEYFKGRQAAIEEYRQAHPLLCAFTYFGIYVVVTALSLPGAVIMTLAGGAIFGLLWATVLVSFASTLGATLAFLGARFLFRDSVRRRFAQRLKSVDQGIEREGAFYLFALRLVPLVPFFVVNLVMGLTAMRALTFAGVSQLGMLPGTLVYVNAGTQLAKVESLSGILSPALIASFVILGVLPLIARRVLAHLRARRVLRRYPKPASFDRNLIVIGAGSAGLVASYIAAAVKAKVTLIERHRMGGDCLNTGCVPSKALIRTSRFIADVRRARDFGCRGAAVDFEFAEVMDRVRRVINAVEPHDSVARYSALGVECLHGEARITTPYTVVVDGRVLTTRSIVIATGARPLVPPIPGLDEIDYLTSDTVWDLSELPARLTVLGGGPIGCELAQCFARLGSTVTIVEMLPRLLIREDPEVAERVKQKFLAEGIEVQVGHTAQRFARDGSRGSVVCEHEGRTVHIDFDKVLVAVGRKPSTRGFGLEELGLALTEQGTLAVNEYLQTNYPNIFACGDVIGPYQFTHVSSHQAWYASVNALFGGFRKFKVDYSVIPWATFTEPEIARVGLSELEAKARGIDYEVTTYAIDDLDRAIADSAAHGMVKVLTVPGKDRILGAAIVGEHAADLITEFIAAMRHGLGLKKILGTIHIYPTLAEANRYAAGNWRREHAPQRILRWLERFHAWQRRGAFNPAARRAEVS